VSDRLLDGTAVAAMVVDPRSPQLAGAAEWEGKRWELRSALRAARRAQDASRRTGRDPAEKLIAAGQDLVLEGDGQFTVKELADRAGVALQTFYRHFGSKDELVLAVLEENVAQGVREMEAAAARQPDPVDQLRELIQLPIRMSTAPESFRRLRFHARERQRLSEMYPAEVEVVFAPYRDLIERHIRAVAAAGRHLAADPHRDADVVMRLVAVYAHAVGTAAVSWSVEECATLVWQFCSAALWRTPVPDRDLAAT
jgi:TetR/AcrR family transcriptional regulator